MEKEPSVSNSEQIPDIDSMGWDNLRDAPNPTFNQSEATSSSELPKNPESHNQEVDRAEALLKNNLIESSEKFTRGERFACAALSDELSRSHLEDLSRPVLEFGDYSSRIDSERFDTLLEYLDQKFSSELSSEEKEKITTELRDVYFKDTKARAGLLAEETDTVWRKLTQKNDKIFSKPIHHIDRIRRDAPVQQVQIAKAYFNYFDEPTDSNKNHLTHKVANYTDLLRRGFGGISEGVIDNKIGSKDLPDAIFLGLGRSSAQNYEEMHDALLKYFDYKTNENLKTEPSPKTESATISPEMIDLDGPTPDSLPSDIF